MGTKAPAFQFYPSEFLADENVVVMSLEECGAYIKLMCYCWREGSIPNDPIKLAKMVGAPDKGGDATLWSAVTLCFDVDPNDTSRLFHPRLEIERVKQEAWRLKSALGGKNSHKNGCIQDIRNSRVVQPHSSHPVKGGPTLQSSSSSSSSFPLSPPGGGGERPVRSRKKRRGDAVDEAIANAIQEIQP
jgi:uncharacterized protein YdaU (DUF1376 family)